MRTSLIALVWLLGLFAISIAVRYEHINRPLSTNYEWVTAHTLVTLQIWQEEGIIEHRFNPIYTFANPNDHHIKCPISGVSDEGGNYYYVSYPPFAFILPHLVFTSVGVDPDVLALQVFNLILHFFCAGLIYLILANLLSSKPSEFVSIPGLVGSSIYIFAPLSLWHHANVYFADILVQIFFLGGLYFAAQLFSKDARKNSSVIGVGCMVFLMAYTEWIGFLFAASLLILAFVYRKHGLLTPKLIAIVIGAVAFAGSLTLLQYSSVSGLSTFMDTVLNRYTERSGHLGNNQFYRLDSHLYLFNVYLRNFFPQFVILVFLGLLFFILKAPLKKILNKKESFILVLALAPALLHHLFLFEFTLVHDLALVKTCVFLSLLTGLLFARVQHHSFNQPGLVFKFVPFFVICSMLALSSFLYHAHVIEPDGFSFEELGAEIRQSSTPDDTIFFKTTQTLGDFLIKAPGNFVMAPQIQYYSGRCIQVVPSLDAAHEHLEQFDKKKGVVYTIENSRYQIENIEQISRDKSQE